MPNYGNPKYWDRRYSQKVGTMFDWLEDYSTLRNVLRNHLSLDSRILIVGCGNATLSEELYDDGYRNIYNMDISSVVI